MGSEQALTPSTDAKERLGPADLRAGGLLAATHVHRYEFAAGLCSGRRVLDLCCGTGYGARILAREAAAVRGVDLSEEALAFARSQLPDDGSSPVTFEREDALAYLRAQGTGQFDAIVCFEGLEHLPDPQAVVGELVRLVGDGTLLLLSMPNSRGFQEENEFHVTDFGYEEMLAAADRFPDAVVLSQYLGEASLILPPDAAPPSEARGRLVDTGIEDGPRGVWANHWLIAVGVDLVHIEQTQAGLALATAPNHNEYMRQLERANAELRRTNARMARSWLGVHDAAAAAPEARRVKLEAKVAELEQQVDREQQTAKSNYEHMLLHKAALEAPRYRAVDAIRTLAFTMPGVAAVLRLRSRLIHRRTRRS
jgi:SAM-dependent methyltransferase